MRPEFRLALPAALGWVAAGIVVGSTPAAGWIAAAGWLTAAGALVAAWRFGPMEGRASVVRAAVHVAMVAATVALLCTVVARGAPIRSPEALRDAAREHSTVDAEALVTGAVQEASSTGLFGQARRVRFTAELSAFSVGSGGSTGGGVPVLVFAALDGGDVPRLGGTMALSGTLRPAEDGDGVAFLMFVHEVPRSLSPPAPLIAWAEPLRADLAQHATGLAGDGGDLLPGLAIGDTDAVADDLDAAMRDASLSHLTAVSGANCAVVVALVMLVGAAIGLPRLLRLVVALLALGAFVVIVTPQPSVLRAGVMAVVVIVATAGGRPGRGVPALSLAVIALLAADPWLSRDYGFALSVLATAGLLVLAGPLARVLARWMPGPLALAVAIPLAAQLACQPVLVLLDPVLPLGGVAANLLAGPAAPVATVLGLCACLLLPLAPGIGDAVLRLAWLPSAWIAGVARTVAGVDGLRLPWPGGVAGVVLIASVTAIALWLVLARRRARTGRGTAMGLAALLLAVGAYGGSLVGGSLARVLGMPSDWLVAACDIGQGDALVVRDGDAYALIDTGPDPAPLDECLDGLGIDRIDLLVLTHYDLDHVGGVDAIIGRVDAAMVGVPETAADDRILSDLARSGTRVLRGVAGDEGMLGGLTWTVLWPDATDRDVSGNDGSITLLIEGRGVRALFLGDLGESAQDAMLSAAHPPPVDIVKVAHHGSGDQSERLYEAAAATLGLISVGRDNGYGHPTDRSLDLLAANGTLVRRTDENGLVLVAPAPEGGLRVWSER